MPVAPDPETVYERATREGHRRLFMPPLEQVATGFIAGVTIVFGIVALGVAAALVAPAFGPDLAHLAGALAFPLGIVFLVVGRSELFSENFFDPVAAAIDTGRRDVWARLGRLWLTTLLLNLAGGVVLVAVVAVDGALPHGADEELTRVAEEMAASAGHTVLARAVLAGALITLLSYMLNAADSTTGRIVVAYLVGFLLALGPFDHVVVSALHLVLGRWLDAPIATGAILGNVGLATVGNLVGGILLVTLTHTAQVKGR